MSYEATMTPDTGSSFGAKKVSPTAPWSWVEKAWADYRREPILCASYGVLFVLVGYAILYILGASGFWAAAPVAVGAFALVGPLMAGGLYAVAQCLERGTSPGWHQVAFVKANSPLQLAYIGLFLMMGLFIWTLCALGLLVIFAATADIPAGEFLSFVIGTPRGLSLLVLGTLVGAAIAFAIFAMTAFSIPMLIDKDTDFATAIAASVDTVLTQPKPMLLWAWIIAGSIVVGGATLLLGFILLFPLIGLATWHGYRETFGAS